MNVVAQHQVTQNVVTQHLKGGPAAYVRVRDCDLDSLSAAELASATSLNAQIIREAQAFQHALVAAGARKQAHKAAGAASMTSMIAADSGVSRAEAARQIKLAEHLEQKPVLREQLSRPGMSTQKAQIVATAMERLPVGLSPDDRQTIEDDLAHAAPGMSVEQLRRKAKRALEVVDLPRANRLENRELERQEEQAHRLASFWMSKPDGETGMVSGGFEIDALSADILRSVLESKTSPRHRSLDHDAPAGHHREHAGAAFCDVLRHLPKDGYGNHGGVAATLMVTIDERVLSEKLEQAGLTEFGTPISAGEARRLACTAGVLPAVLGGASEVLDVGREQRLHTPAQRRALAHRDAGCAFPGCDRPPGWCESHHITSWSDGGGTSVDNGVLMCGFHHRLIHSSGWRIEINRLDKIPDFFRPGSSTPVRNTRYRPLRA